MDITYKKCQSGNRVRVEIHRGDEFLEAIGNAGVADFSQREVDGTHDIGIEEFREICRAYKLGLMPMPHNCPKSIPSF